MSSSIELVQKGFAAFAAGDMATLGEVIADDVVWVSESGGILAGRQEGKAAVFARWAMIPAETQGTFRQDVVEIFGDDRVVVAVTEITADRKGKHADKQRSVIVFVLKDGQVAEGRIIAGDPDADNDFWAE